MLMILVYILVHREYAGTPFDKSVTLEESIKKETSWYDIYRGSIKLGYAKKTIDKIGNEIILTETRNVKVLKNGEETEQIDALKSLCNLDYSVKSFEYSSRLRGETGIKAKGEVTPEGLVVFLESSIKRRTLKVATNGKKFYLPTTITMAIHQQKPSVNAPMIVPLLDLMSLSIDDVRVVLEEIHPIKVRINVQSIYRYKMGNTYMWMNDQGRVLKEEIPQMITLYFQLEQFAKDPENRALFDYTFLPFQKVEKEILRPEKLKTLKVRVKGYRFDPELYKNTSIILENNVFTIHKEDSEYMKNNSYKLPLASNPYLDKYLASDKWLMIEDKTVRGNALAMVDIEKNDAFRMARYLTSNLYFTVSPFPMFTLANARELFDTHLGSHLERSLMFAAFARAGGLPTRMVGGLVYKEGYFYYHSWPEVWFDRWIPVDPSLAQFPADVTHIPFVEGTLDDIISITDKLRTITIEIMEAA